MIAIVFSCASGFVTDFGEPVRLKDADGRTVLTLPRFGVWRFDGARGKPEVNVTTDNLDDAIAAASESPRSITCPKCGRTSYNLNDIREGYCGACHAWTSAKLRESLGGWCE